MGISEGTFRLLLCERGYLPVGGTLLTFGVQDIWFTYGRAVRILEEAGQAYRAVPPSERKVSTSRFLRAAFGRGDFLHQDTLFRMLGADEVHSLDRSAEEGATRVHDMNEPIPDAWAASCDAILDSGSMEHVFDVRTCIANLHRLLRPGGSLVFCLPIQMAIDHGFYMFSPTLFFDAYGGNGYTHLKGYLLESPPTELPGSRCYATPYEYGDRFAMRRPHHALYFFFCARKPVDDCLFAVVQQRRYVRGIENTGVDGGGVESAWKTMARNIVKRIDPLVPASLSYPWARFTRRATPGRRRIRL